LHTDFKKLEGTLVTASGRREPDNVTIGDIRRMNLPRKTENQRRRDLDFNFEETFNRS